MANESEGGARFNGKRLMQKGWLWNGASIEYGLIRNEKINKGTHEKVLIKSIQ